MDDFLDCTELFVWGNAVRGQLACDSNASPRLPCPRALSLGFLIRAVACGDEHTLLLTDTSLVYAVGSNSDGRLGLGDTMLRETNVPVVVKDLSHARVTGVACGGGHSAAITSEGAVYVWGKGDSGALGLSSLDNEFSPQPLKLPSSLRIRQISCGSRHTALLAVTSESKGTLLTCGSGDLGQLGSQSRIALTPAVVSTDGEVKQVSCGVVHTVFTTYTGKVYATGSNSLGQLGLGNKTSSRTPQRVRALEGVFIEKVACGNHTAALSDKGDLYLWGTGAFGEKLLPSKVAVSVPFRDIEVGGCFGAALDVTKRMWTWGTNSNGELGQCDFKQRKVPTLVQTISKRAVKSFACGIDFVIALGGETKIKHGKQRDNSPFSRLNLPVARARPFSEISTPKSRKDGAQESPISLKLAAHRSPSEFLFSPKRDTETIPETMETEPTDDRRSGVIRHVGRLTSEGFVMKARISDECKGESSVETDKSAEELLSLRGKLITAENSIEALSARINILEREIEAKRDSESRFDSMRSRLKFENADLMRKLQTKEEELAVAVSARGHMQTAYDRISESSQRLISDLRNEKAGKERLHSRVVELEQEIQRLTNLSTSKGSSLSPSNRFQQTFSRPLIEFPIQSNPPDIISRAKSKKERTLRLLSTINPPDPRSPQSSLNRDEELNLRFDELQDSSHADFTHSVTSIGEAMSQDVSQPIKSSPNSRETKLKTDRGERRDTGKQPKLRNNVSDLKGKLKALKDNQPALESKISAFERRLRGSKL